MVKKSASKSLIVRHFAVVSDPRKKKNRKHLLIDIIVIVLCGVLSGSDDFVHIAEFAKAKKGFFSRILKLPHGIPSHDVLNDVFARIKPSEFLEAFTAWIAEIATMFDNEIIAIDGKTLRRSFDKASSKAAIHMVSAWACKNGVSLGQVKVDDKSNEIKAIPKLLEVLDIAGCIVTIDAVGCQRDICAKIIEEKGDYCIVVKDNQPKLLDAVKSFFDLHEPAAGGPYKTMETADKGHGREERRQYFSTDEIDSIQNELNWPGLKSIGLAKSTRIVNGHASYEERFYVCSFPANAEKFADASRSHWRVENSLHWQLDVTMGEDKARLRKDHGAENMGHLRRLAINMLKKETTNKGSMSVKRTWCAASEDYLIKVLTS